MLREKDSTLQETPRGWRVTDLLQEEVELETAKKDRIQRDQREKARRSSPPKKDGMSRTTRTVAAGMRRHSKKRRNDIKIHVKQRKMTKSQKSRKGKKSNIPTEKTLRVK